MKTHTFNRRSVLAGIAAGAATPFFSACSAHADGPAPGTAPAPTPGTTPAGVIPGSGETSAAPPPSGAQRADVVVVGAGYSGLACARTLAANGVDVRVLEGRGRVGGRCVNQRLPAPFDAYVVEGGAEFIGPQQLVMQALVQELGIGTFDAFNAGQTVNYMNGQATPYSGRIPPGNPLDLLGAQNAITTLNNMAATVNTATPWTASSAAKWDAMTVQDWIDNAIGIGADQHPPYSAGTKKLLQLAIIAIFSVEPRDVSLLYLLFYIAGAAGDINQLIDTQGGAQQTRITGGSQAIAIAMANTIGDRIAFNAPVTQVDQTASSIVASGTGFSVTAQHAVIAMSPWPAGRIHYTPLHSSDASPDDPANTLAGRMQARLQLMQHYPMGSIWKVHCVYETPFWRANGLNGQVTSDAFLPKVTFDNTPPEDGAPGVIMGFIDGQDARDTCLMTRAQRMANVIQAFTAYFGSQAANPLAYLESNWQGEDFSGGGPVGVPGPGVITGYTAALAAPIGRLHWAGTETATRWSGYMDGAVSAGERAAQEVLAAL